MTYLDTWTCRGIKKQNDGLSGRETFCDILSRFDTVYVCDRRTFRRTPVDGLCRAYVKRHSVKTEHFFNLPYSIKSVNVRGVCSANEKKNKTNFQSTKYSLEHKKSLNKLCGRPPQYASAPCKLNFVLLTLKVVSESRVLIIIIIKHVLIKVTLSCQKHCRSTAQSLTSKKE